MVYGLGIGPKTSVKRKVYNIVPAALIIYIDA